MFKAMCDMTLNYCVGRHISFVYVNSYIMSITQAIDRTELIPQSRAILEKMVIALPFDRFSTLL
jgi:hypothetical protein